MSDAAHLINTKSHQVPVTRVGAAILEGVSAIPQVAVQQPEFTPQAGLRRMGETAMALLGVGLVYKVTGLGISCGLIKFGIYCPFCGGTRMVASLLGGHPVAAFHWNPMLFVAGILMVVVTLFWAGELIGGPRLRWPRSWRVSQNRIYLVAGVASLAFMAVRNLA